MVIVLANSQFNCCLIDIFDLMPILHSTCFRCSIHVIICTKHGQCDSSINGDYLFNSKTLICDQCYEYFKQIGIKSKRQAVKLMNEEKRSKISSNFCLML